MPRMQLRDLSRMAALVVAACGGLAACGGAGCGGTRTPTQPSDDSGIGDSATGDAATGDSAGDASGPPPDGGSGLGPLRVDPRNPRYFTDGSGKAIYLTGSHTWANLKDRVPPGASSAPPFNYAAFLDFLIAHHHNFMRLWTSEQPHSADDDTGALATFSPFPWLRTGPGMANDGKLRFDLDKLDPAYFSRMRERVIAARDRGIYVAVMLFDGWALVTAYSSDSGGFPMGSGNNINNVAANGPEVFAGTSSTVAALQEAYVRAAIEAVNDLDNVLYEIVNETDTNGVAWQYQMIDLVKSIERGKPKQHPVGMTSTYPGTDDDLFKSHADWISPNNPIAPGDGRKVILNDTDHSYGWRQLQRDGPTAQRAWRGRPCVGARRRCSWTRTSSRGPTATTRSAASRIRRGTRSATRSVGRGCTPTGSISSAPCRRRTCARRRTASPTPAASTWCTCRRAAPASRPPSSPGRIASSGTTPPAAWSPTPG